MKMCFYHPSRNVSDEERAAIEKWGYTLVADQDCPRTFMHFMSRGDPSDSPEVVADA